jgi:GNAT superfamily N-acetyltransferase
MSVAEATVVTMQQRPDLIQIADNTIDAAWPEIILNLEEAVSNQYWWHLWRTFPAFQVVMMSPATEEIMAVGNSLPLAWDGPPDALPDQGWDWALTQGFEDQATGRAPTMLCALSVSIPPTYRGQGLSGRMVRALHDIARAHGLPTMIAPVRPNLKAAYPVTPIERYIRWQRDDGLPFDPWMRVHARLGATVVKVCPQSMTVTGTVPQWERRTGMQFPESGRYVVPEALVPVEIDRETDRGTYIEPNVWMWHALA